MIDQRTLDDLADDLVARGIRVTVENTREAFRERSSAASSSGRGTSHSPRDIEKPLNDWKRRRRYRPHLAIREMDEEVDKALAASLDAIRKAAGRIPADVPPMVADQDLTKVMTLIESVANRLEGRIDVLTAENAGLRREMTAGLRLNGSKAIRKGRKSGVFDSTSRHFWDQLMQMFQRHIKAVGPKPVEDLLALVDQDTFDLAALAFEPIDTAQLREKLKIRVGATNYFKLEDGLYHLLPSEPKKARSNEGKADKPKLRTKRRIKVAGNG